MMITWRKFKQILAGIGIFFTVVLIGLFLFFYIFEAPVTIGQKDLHVPYKGDLTLDIYYPTKQVHEKSPVIMYVHGGAWVGGRKELINMNRINGAIKLLRDEGYTIICPEYTLARNGQSPFPKCIEDGYDALQWITVHADSLELDLYNLGMIGESAGAHIAMMNAYASPKSLGYEHSLPSIDYVVDIYGPNNLENLRHTALVDSVTALIEHLPETWQENVSLPHILFGFDPEANPEKAKFFTSKFSPINYISPQTPPTLMIHGNQDKIVPVTQSRQLKKALDSLKIPNELHTLEGVKHAFRGANTEQKTYIQQTIYQFIHEQYNQH